MSQQALIQFQIAPEFANQIDEGALAAALRHAVMAEQQPSDSALTVVIVDDATITAMHERYRNEPGPTDVLTFPYEDVGLEAEMSSYLGDIIIGYEQAARQAAELGHSTQEELTLIVLHGFLHLLGHDDEEPSARHDMWQRQNALLAAVGLAHIAPAE